MTDKFQNRYRIGSIRKRNWDYGWNGAYFVTICTTQKENYFGEICQIRRRDAIHRVSNDISYTPNEDAIHRVLNDISTTPDRDAILPMDQNVMMPNEGDAINRVSTAKTIILSKIGEIANHLWYEIPNHFPYVQLGEFVVMPNHIHGIIILDPEAYQGISTYIRNNPSKWKDDKFFD